jgi:hypothetical protein
MKDNLRKGVIKEWLELVVEKDKEIAALKAEMEKQKIEIVVLLHEREEHKADMDMGYDSGFIDGKYEAEKSIKNNLLEEIEKICDRIPTDDPKFFVLEMWEHEFQKLRSTDAKKD